MRWVRQAMVDTGILFELGGSLLFLEKFSTDKKVFNCVSTFIMIAIAHEFGWPVHAVLAPNHIFPRWGEDESGNFDVPNGAHYENNFYVRLGMDPAGNLSSGHHRARIDQVSLDDGVYLRNLEPPELEAVFFFNIGQALSLMTPLFGNQFDSAVDAYDESLRFLPQNAMALAGRGLAEIELGQWDEAQSDFTEAVRLDPNLALAYEGLGKTFTQSGNFEAAIQNLDTAIELHETASAHINRGVAKYRMGLATEDEIEKRHLLREALADYRRALHLEPGNEVATFNIEVVQSILGEH